MNSSSVTAEKIFPDRLKELSPYHHSLMSGKVNGARPVITKEQMIQYLYGELDEPARTQLEEQFFADQEQFAALERVEDQLIDDYVGETLSVAERRKFETAYLISARRREKLQFAQDLHQSLRLSPRIARPSFSALLWAKWQVPTLRYGLVAATAAFVLLGIWWTRTSFRNPAPAQIAQSSVPSPAAPAASVRENLPPLPSATVTENPAPLPPKQPSSGAILLSVLSPEQLRDNSSGKATNKLVVTPAVKIVLLQMQTPREAPYTAYRVVIETASGQAFFTQENVPVRGNQLRLALPVSRLHTEDYVLTLSGKTADQAYEEIRDYSFRVVKQ